MDELFEKLKAEPPVNRTTENSDSSRRDSLPSLKPASTVPPINKSRSMSPTNCNTVFEKKIKSSLVQTKKEEASSNANTVELGSEGNGENPKKQMPTKAQKKLFEPSMQPASEDRVRPCKVRIKRDDLEKLRKKFASEKSKKTRKSKEKPTASPTKTTTKRKGDSTKDSPTSPAKKIRSTKESPPKKSTGFFIKLNSTIPSTKKPSVNKQRSKSQSPTMSPRKINVRAVSSSPIWTTKATKFTRTQLIKNFGKRFFKSTVRIERCRHPLMLMFEFNARARKQQTKNKSKNLSVSFKEQVEIIGDSDTESNYSDENAAGTKSADDKAIVATPARLKKVENGKVIDDIEFDPALFIGGDAGNNSSTPLRKKTEKKSYSPLKDDSSSSARSEQLKLANEKLPPCGLRRLRDTTADDDDDDDDECEYIVPIDIPEKRSSRANSINNGKDLTEPIKGSDVDNVPTTNNTDESDKEKSLSVKSSSESIILATEEKLSTLNNGSNTKITELSKKDPSEALESSTKEKQNSENDKENSEFLKKLKTTSESSASEKQNDIEYTNGNATVTKNTDALSKDDKSSKNNKSAVDGNESIHFMLDNDSSALTPTVSFTSDSQDNTSESIVKTVIDKLSEDIELPEINKAEEKEQSTTVKSIKTDKTTSIST